MPNPKDYFRAFDLCELKNLKVVILGQDPYHTLGVANGLAFSVRKQQKIPPSLQNIFKELKTDLGIDNTHGDLTNWAKQGVENGAGEILLTSMTTDGMKTGYNLNLTRLVSENVSVPVIASGGAGDYSHFADLFRQTGIDGALAASVFHSGKIPIPKLKAYLQTKLIEVRV